MSVDVISSHLFPPLLVARCRAPPGRAKDAEFYVPPRNEACERFVIWGREVENILQIFAAYWHKQKHELPKGLTVWILFPASYSVISVIRPTFDIRS